MKLLKSVKILAVLTFLLLNQAAFSKSAVNLQLSQEAIQKINHREQQSIELLTQKKFTFIIRVEHNSVMMENWAKKLCSETAATITEVYGPSTQSHCFFKGSQYDNTDLIISEKNKEIQADFQLDLIRNLENTISVKLVNLQQLDKNFTNRVGWKIAYSQDFQKDLRQQIISSSFAINNLAFIRNALVDLIYEESKVIYDFKIHGSRENFYQKLTKSKYWTPKTKKFLTVGTELLATLSFGWYGYNFLTTNTQDFDYEQEGMIKGFKNKLSSGSMVRYDDNSWGVNRNHVYAGVVYYLECRGAGFTALESYLCAIAGSTAWEALVEWREVFSINDQIFTAGGGAILAESIHQMGNYIDHKAPKWFQNTIGWAWKGPKKMTEAMNGRLYKGTDSDLENNDNPIASGKFEFEIGTIKTSNGKSEKRVGITNEVNLIPFSTEPGHEVKFINNIVETQFSFDGSTQSIANQYDIFAKVVMAAYYNKNIQKDSNNQLNGYSFYVGPSAAIDIRNQQDFNDDFMGIVHIAGGTAKIVNYYKGLKITSSLDFWGDSVMMKSFMIEKYKAVHGREDLVQNLASANYYNGWGVTTQGQVIVEFGKWSSGLNISYNSAVNTNTRQRNLGAVLKELEMNDQALNTEVFIERTINPNFKVKFSLENYNRSGAILNFAQGKSSTSKARVSLVYYF